MAHKLFFLHLIVTSYDEKSFIVNRLFVDESFSPFDYSLYTLHMDRLKLIKDVRFAKTHHANYITMLKKIVTVTPFTYTN